MTSAMSGHLLVGVVQACPCVACAKSTIYESLAATPKELDLWDEGKAIEFECNLAPSSLEGESSSIKDSRWTVLVSLRALVTQNPAPAAVAVKVALSPPAGALRPTLWRPPYTNMYTDRP
jgi:hypothetical protein